MSSNLKENDIADYLFERLSSDGNGLTDVDDFLQSRLFSTTENIIEVVEWKK